MAVVFVAALVGVIQRELEEVRAVVIKPEPEHERVVIRIRARNGEGAATRFEAGGGIHAFTFHVVLVADACAGAHHRTVVEDEVVGDLDLRPEVQLFAAVGVDRKVGPARAAFRVVVGVEDNVFGIRLGCDGRALAKAELVADGGFGAVGFGVVVGARCKAGNPAHVVARVFNLVPAVVGAAFHKGALAKAVIAIDAEVVAFDIRVGGVDVIGLDLRIGIRKCHACRCRPVKDLAVGADGNTKGVGVIPCRSVARILRTRAADTLHPHAVGKLVAARGHVAHILHTVGDDARDKVGSTGDGRGHGVVVGGRQRLDDGVIGAFGCCGVHVALYGVKRGVAGKADILEDGIDAGSDGTAGVGTCHAVDFEDDVAAVGTRERHARIIPVVDKEVIGKRRIGNGRAGKVGGFGSPAVDHAYVGAVRKFGCGANGNLDIASGVDAGFGNPAGKVKRAVGCAGAGGRGGGTNLEHVFARGTNAVGVGGNGHAVIDLHGTVVGKRAVSQIDVMRGRQCFGCGHCGGRSVAGGSADGTARGHAFVDGQCVGARTHGNGADDTRGAAGIAVDDRIVARAHIDGAGDGATVGVEGVTAVIQRDVAGDGARGIGHRLHLGVGRAGDIAGNRAGVGETACRVFEMHGVACRGQRGRGSNGARLIRRDGNDVARSGVGNGAARKRHASYVAAKNNCTAVGRAGVGRCNKAGCVGDGIKVARCPHIDGNAGGCGGGDPACARCAVGDGGDGARDVKRVALGRDKAATRVDKRGQYVARKHGDAVARAGLHGARVGDRDRVFVDVDGIAGMRGSADGGLVGNRGAGGARADIDAVSGTRAAARDNPVGARDRQCFADTVKDDARTVYRAACARVTAGNGAGAAKNDIRVIGNFNAVAALSGRARCAGAAARAAVATVTTGNCGRAVKSDGTAGCIADDGRAARAALAAVAVVGLCVAAVAAIAAGNRDTIVNAQCGCGLAIEIHGVAAIAAAAAVMRASGVTVRIIAAVTAILAADVAVRRGVDTCAVVNDRRGYGRGAAGGGSACRTVCGSGGGLRADIAISHERDGMRAAGDAERGHEGGGDKKLANGWARHGVVIPRVVEFRKSKWIGCQLLV